MSTIANQAESAFNTCLDRIRFDAPTSTYIISQGFKTAEESATLPTMAFDDMMKSITRTPQATGRNAAPNTAALTFPYIAQRNLKTFRM
jgi:hypothetical protein